MLDDRIHFLAGEYYRDIRPPLGANHIPKLTKLLLEHVPEEEEKRIECLVLRGSRNIAFDRKIGEEFLNIF